MRKSVLAVLAAACAAVPARAHEIGMAHDHASGAISEFEVLCIQIVSAMILAAIGTALFGTRRAGGDR